MTKPRALTHEQRRALIKQPIITRIHGGKAHGGCWVRQEPLPESGRRRYTPSPEDEQLFVKISQE